MSIDQIFAIYAAVLGLVVGSYLNVVNYRLPRGLSTVRPRSRCPRCQRAIAPWDNIPVLSYLMLRGKCRDCGMPIHWRYPLLEIVTGVLFLLSYLAFGVSIDMAVAMGFCASMVVLAVLDLEHRWLPDVVNLPLVALGLLVQLPSVFGTAWISWVGWKDVLIGTIGGPLVLLALRQIWMLLRGVPGIGLGDVKMVAAFGAILGWRGLVVALAVASFTGTLVALVAIARRRMHLGSSLPFGFFLALGGLVALFLGSDLMSLYAGWVRELVP
ncbi:MAG: prepilin peptidase [Acidobacteriota bacterium]